MILDEWWWWEKLKKFKFSILSLFLTFFKIRYLKFFWKVWKYAKMIFCLSCLLFYEKQQKIKRFMNVNMLKIYVLLIIGFAFLAFPGMLFAQKISFCFVFYFFFFHPDNDHSSSFRNFSRNFLENYICFLSSLKV